MISNFYLKNNIKKNHFSFDLNKRLSKNYDKIFNKIVNQIELDRNTLNVLNQNFIFNFKTNHLNRFQKFKNIVVIGMGGSILGIEAIYQFLHHKIKKNCYFLGDFDIKKIEHIKKKLKKNKTLYLVISKSGNTIETLSTSFFLEIFKKDSKNIILISERKNNVLFNLAKNKNLFYIEHKNFIGGRYSVLSEVGMIPAFLMGLNIRKLRLNIKKFIKNKKEKNFLKESVIMMSTLLAQGKYKNLIFLNYSPKLEKFVYWCQQLIAESLGKKGKGFLPTISNVPKDHHSLLQLYLDGPKDKIFQIISIKKEDGGKKIKIPFSNNNEMKYLENKDLNTIKEAQKKALIETLKLNKIPYREFQFRKKNQELLGELFSYFILETVLIAEILKINPYNQPAVEQVKSFTKKFLK